uniref:Uncharacterized protein n=1 Tax=Arundo donax TaxID=35708 RepID=A0A0A9CUI6_ARUDO
MSMMAADGHRSLKQAQMARRLLWYSSSGACWCACARSASEASLAPKKTVTAAGSTPAGAAPSMARGRTLSAHRVLYPLSPRSTTSAWRAKRSARAAPHPPAAKDCSVMESPKSTSLGRILDWSDRGFRRAGSLDRRLPRSESTSTEHFTSGLEDPGPILYGLVADWR